MRQAIALVIVAVLLAAGCSKDSSTTASRASNFTTGICTSVLQWDDDMVDAANRFTDDSPFLTETQRRARYLFAFDEQQRITEDLRDNINTAPPTGVDDPDAVRVALSKAIDAVEKNIADQKADAAANVDFRFIGPRPDRLFAGTEKSESLFLKPMNEVARDQNIAALGGDCGRGGLK